ncbi:hypothetical protein PV08_04644 [Exophiala spinifera]|uniref:Zn(2)-C6 fungal-type domain-containing protein n=1 Tax=Exophiala spinifera TaxID=91928 RepID=A0A0D2BFS5_9EURO|nr:uncharacterized protein PV08_04644 [Exophiala spinifera]KIW17450.1 hypothetical protein PV08_04644 [Exophiala spinifera]
MEIHRETPNSPKPARAKACLECRRLKMKCRPVAGNTICERCRQKSMDCIFHEKKRGRKPANARQIASRPALPSGSVADMKDVDHVRTYDSASLDQMSPGNASEDEDRDFLADSEGFQPSGLLNKQATTGAFSLKNILSTSPNVEHNTSKDTATIPEDDPVRKNIVSYHIATSLFEGFMKNLNPFICVLDPELYTFEYVRTRSPFLFAVILAASAKAFNPPLYLDLHRYAETLYGNAFCRGEKSPEIIQAFIISTYWKQPDDTRSWSVIGYAIRLCMELGFHKLVFDPKYADPETPEFEVRQRRNIERIWLLLFVYDRSMSLQTGKPWMIERSEFIESVNTWYRNPMAISNDAMMAALVTLRIASADILEAFNPQRPAPSMIQAYRFDSLLKTHSIQIEAWKKHWVEITSDRERCHPFLVSFFGTHLSLLLYSFKLQGSIASPLGASLVDTEAFWITYTSALEMLQLVSQPALTALLSFAHDSIHTMTAYAAAFLIKLLLSVNVTIRKQFENTVMKTIDQAAAIFAQQSAPPTFGCALQANFLTNVLREYKKACHRRSQPRKVAEDVTRAQAPSSGGVTDMTPNMNQAEQRQSTFLTWNEHVRPPPIATSSGRDVGDGQLRGTASANFARHRGIDISESFTGDTNTSANNLVFYNDEDWSAIFANAGFNITGGVFIPG